MKRTLAPSLLLFAMLLAGCQATSTNTTPAPAAADWSAPTAGEMQVVAPRAYPTAVEALQCMWRQTGTRYAVLVPEPDATIGPLSLDKPIGRDALLGRIAEATGTRVAWVDGVAVLEGTAAGGAIDLSHTEKALAKGSDAGLLYARQAPNTDDIARIFEVGRLFQARALAPLSKLARHDDERIRTLAVRLLADVEGDFRRNEWPGRVSVYELLVDDLDCQGLIWLAEEGAAEGGVAWNAAVDVLARARWPFLSRLAWWKVYQKNPGTMETAMWAISRVDDPSAAWSLKNRIERTFTNWPEHRWLAAKALGVRDPGRLVRYSRDGSWERRAAAAFGIGFTDPSSSRVAEILDRALKDDDQAVRFVACQSAARIGTAKWIDRLATMALDPKADASGRVAALTALGQVAARVHPAARTKDVPKHLAAILVSAGDGNATIRTTAARMLGEVGGAGARSRLTAMLDDADKWVAAEAAMQLARLGDEKSVAKVADLLLAGDTPTDVRIAAMIGLRRGHGPAAADALVQVASNGEFDVRVRRYAILALARLADHAGADAMSALASLSHPAHDWVAVRYLDLPSERDVWQQVRGITTAGGRSDSAAAANRLAELGYGPGVRDLLEGFDVFDNSARMQHMWGAIRSRGPGSTAALIESASNPRTQIRVITALALAERIDPDAVEALLKLSRDSSAGVRARAAEALWLTGDPAAVPRLIEMALTDENPRAWSAAIRALRRRDWAGRKDVRAAFAELSGTPRDCGVIDADAPSLREQPAHSFVLRKWPGDYGDLRITNITYESSLTYDSDRGRVVQWGSHGRRADAPQQGQTWFYHADNNEWRRLFTSRQWPNGVCLTWGTTYDPANQVVVSPVSGRGGHGWVNYLRADLSTSIPWVLDARRDEWHGMAPPEGMSYSLGQVQGTFASGPDVVLFHWGNMKAYDAYANRWLSVKNNNRPGYGASSTWDPVEERLIALAPGVEHMQTWAWRPADGRWQNLHAAGGPPGTLSRLVYDSANDVMLAFSAANNGLAVHAYHIRENRWESLPMVYPTPRFHDLDTAYDSENNVVVFSGGWETGHSGEPTQRETWTYRYKPADPDAPRPIGKVRDMTVTTAAGGAVTVTWRDAPGAATHRVLRGSGDVSWEAKLSEAPAQATLDAGKTWWFRVEALDADGKVIARSPLRPSRPKVVDTVWAAATGQGVRVSWHKSESGDVVGYRIYRADVDLGDPWNSRYAHWNVGEGLQLVSGDAPVTGTTFVDTSAASKGPGDETRWPGTYAYVVKPVNAWGAEGGPSPATLAIADPPGPVRVIPWADGRRMVVWPASRTDADLAGYHVMRMDDWNGQSVYRFNGAPTRAAGFWDDADWPAADRRRYYVQGVDANGVVGVPSSGAWSHGLP